MEQQKVWVPCVRDGFTLGVIQDIGSDEATVLRFNDGQTVRSAYDRLHQAGDQDLQGNDVDDNCALMYLNEGSLLNNLRVRFGKQKIYTYVGSILVAVNPYKTFSELYDRTAIDRYAGKSLGTLPPHIFAIADQALRDMRVHRQSQSVIVSGESGAGKTESTKHVLRYVCESWGGQGGPVERLLLDANPLLEAFGNAKTVRNNNSSRFGKFIEVHFDGRKLVGGHVSHYLLERSRVVSQAAEERNFHIFYQLLAGLPQTELNRLHLKPADQHRYLNGGCTRFFSRQSQSTLNNSLDSSRSSADQIKFGCLPDQVVDDVEDLRRLQKTLTLFGLTTDRQRQLFEMVAAILHVGDIEFEEQADGACVVQSSSRPSLNFAAELLQVDSDSICQALLSRVVQTARGGGGGRGTVYLLPRRLFECRQSRDALAKALYARLFEHVLSHVVNAALPVACNNTSNNSSANQSIGVLDVAGFECFDRNGFEQLCVNFGNERLQQFFAERVLADEQRLYKSEGLNVRPVAFDDSSACVSLFERSPDGLWAMLDEEARLPRPAAAHFTERLLQTHARNAHLCAPRQSPYKTDRQLLPQEAFVVRHFAGPVCYRSEHFLQKNSDALAPQLLQLLLDSNCSFVQTLFELDAKASEKAPTAGPNARAPSVSGVFRTQLNELLLRLRLTGTHFVRCIKPNQEMMPTKFDGAHVLAQLRCSGMHSVLELMQRGFPSRTSFAELYAKYESGLPAILRRLEPRLFCRMLFRALGLADDDFRFGTSKVFLRAGKFAEFDQLIKSDPAHVRQLIDRVQKHLRTMRWKQAQWTVLSVIKLKYKIEFRRKQIVRIQAHLRRCAAICRYRPLIRGLIQVKQLIVLSDQLSSEINQLGDKLIKNRFQNDLQQIRSDVLRLHIQLKNDQLDDDSGAQRNKCKLNAQHAQRSQKVESLVKALQDRLQQVVQLLKQSMQQQQQLLEMQQKLEAEKQRLELEEQRRQQEQERLRKKEQLEERRKQQEARDQQQLCKSQVQTVMAAQSNGDHFNLTDQIIREDGQLREKLQQEQADHEMAVRLAGQLSRNVNDPCEQVTATEISYAAINLNKLKIEPGQRLDLSKWKYSELRDIINTSCDLALLECCRNEFHRRLKVYHAWKSRNTQQQSSNHGLQGAEQRAPDSIMQQSPVDLGGDHSNVSALFSGQAPEQRYFRIPFVRPASLCGEKGWWWAHFDGQWIARQMEVQPNKQPLLLVAGQNDMQMCELSLDETRLTSKRGAEVLREEFELEWQKHVGPKWTGRR